MRTTDVARHGYAAYGLQVASDLELPELVRAPGPIDEPDLSIRLGPTPDRIDGALESRVTWSARPGAWLQTIDGVGRFYVHDDGREVVIERTGGTDADLRAFFFGTVLGAIFHQRRQFVLHACAVALPGGAVAVAGHTGAGKSTTLATLLGRGYDVLSDDKTLVHFGPDGPEVLSGYPTLRLWRDAVKRIGADPDTLLPVRTGTEKYVYRTAAFRSEPVPLRAIVVLNARNDTIGADEGPAPDGDAVVSSRVRTHDAIGILLRQTYRRLIVHGSGLRAEHFQWVTRLADSVPVVHVVRPRVGDTAAAVADAVETAVNAPETLPLAD